MERQEKFENQTQNGGEPVNEAENELKETSHGLSGTDKFINSLGILIVLLLGVSALGTLANQRFFTQGWTRITEIDGREIGQVYNLTLAPNGEIWIASGNPAQLYWFDGTSWNSGPLIGRSLGWITDVVVSPEGELWISAQKTIYHYDGKKWTSYSQADDWYGYKDISISPDGSVWVPFVGKNEGRFCRGVSKFNGKTWTSYIQGNCPLCDQFTDIVVSPENIVWVVDKSGLSSFDGDEWTNYPYPLEKNIGSQPSILLKGEQLWVYSGEGFICLEGHKWIDCPFAEVSLVEHITGMTISRDGALWLVASERRHLNFYRFGHNARTTYSTSPQRGGFFGGIVTDQQNRIWVALGNEVIIFNPQKAVSSEISWISSNWTSISRFLFPMTSLCLVILIAVWIEIKLGDDRVIVEKDLKKYKYKNTLLLLIWAATGVLGSISTQFFLYSLPSFSSANIVCTLLYLPSAITGAITATLAHRAILRSGHRTTAVIIATVVSALTGLLIYRIILAIALISQG